MTTAEYAQLAAEQAAPVLRIPRWAAVRWCAAFVYVATLVAYAAVWGIPVQRELVVSWTCGALVCASIGRPPREILQLVVDWLPIVAVLAVYDFTRGRRRLGRHRRPQRADDRLRPFRLLRPDADPNGCKRTSTTPAPCTGTTSPSRSSTPPTSSSPSPSPASSGRGTGSPSCASPSGSSRLPLAGLATYVLFPAAPPWMAAEQGLLQRRPTDHRPGLGSPRRAAPRSCSPTARRTSTTSPPCPPCTPPSSPSSRSSSGRGLRPALRPLLLALPAGDGPDPDGDRRALLLRRRARLALRRRRDGRLGLVGTAAGRDG